MYKRPGYIKLAQVGGIELLVHWSLPTGGVLLGSLVHAEPRQWGYFCLAYLSLVIIHETGHLLATVALGLKVFSVEISGVGGLCRIEMPRRVRDSVVIFSAGLLAQAVVYFTTLAYVNAFGPPTNLIPSAFVVTFTYVNVVLFVINLIPQRNARSGLATDGAVLWGLFLHVLRGHPHPHQPVVAKPTNQSPIFPEDTQLLTVPGFRPAGFVHGIEILNDRTTPMEFVVNCLTAHLGLTQKEAIVTMLNIHNTGGALIALSSAMDAQRIADTLSAEARAAGHSLVCRYAAEDEQTLENPGNHADRTQHPEDQSTDRPPTTGDGERLQKEDCAPFSTTPRSL
jgi:ATP-dependent Clp protease adapter protein ClpS